MSREDVERLLKSLPVRTLSPAAEEQIVAAVHAAGVRRPDPAGVHT